jgi:hypothetical protein
MGDFGNRLRFTHSGFPEERKAEAKVGAVNSRGKRLDQDIDDHVGVRELGVELVAAMLAPCCAPRRHTASGSRGWREGRTRR